MHSEARTGKSRWVLITASVMGLLILCALASHRSSEPWILGVYSLPYLVFLISSGGVMLFLSVLFYRFGARAFWILVAIVGGILLFALAAETAGQTYAFFHPAYDVLAWAPDRVVGWKQVPLLRWPWAGHEWYARDFSVRVTTNSLGFRDGERAIPKPGGSRRVALLGDSLVEAVQVPLSRTAGCLLERELNASARTTAHAPRYEVLNFGISNYGIGQYLLTWEAYARQFAPDLVFIPVADFHMLRTVAREERSAFSPQEQKPLRIRPTFRLEDDRLVREPARDYAEFVRIQQELIRTRFGGGRVLRKRPRFFLGDMLLESVRQAGARLLGLQRLWAPSAGYSPKPIPQISVAILALNLRIIEELGREVAENGGRLVVMDVASYFNPWSGSISSELERLCSAKGFGYISLSDSLLRANQDGVATHWKHDGHFNEAGNQIFAEAMYKWIVREGAGE